MRSNHRWSDRYKLFNNRRLRQVVLNRLVKQLEAAGSCRKRPETVMCLAAAKVLNEADKLKLIAHFKERRWIFLDDKQIQKSLEDVSRAGFENDIAVVVAKL